MRRLTLAAVGAVALAACTDPTTSIEWSSQGTLASSPTLERTRIEEIIVFPVPRGCTGEPVAWTLRQEILLTTTIDESGGFHGSFHFHDLGSSGVGLVTGAQYRLSQAQNESYNVGGDALPTTDTAIFLRRFISQGSLPNFRVTNVFHYTIDAQGTLTAYRNTFDRTCD